MAINYSSPGITVREIDKSISIIAAESTVGGTVGEFSWGTCFEPVFVASESDMLYYFGKPTERNARFFLSATDFLSYSGALQVVRAVDEATAKNAVANGTPVLIANRGAYDLLSNSAKATVRFAAKYPGILGNSLEVQLADAGNFEHWEYAHLFSAKPETSPYAAKVGAKNDEVHVVVIDRGGLFSGIPGTVLESYEFLSKARDGKSLDLNNNYFVNKINEESDYVYFMSAPEDSEYDGGGQSKWGDPLQAPGTGAPADFKLLKMPEHGKDGASAPAADNLHTGFGGKFTGGAIGDELADEDFIKGWDIFRNAEDTAAELLFIGAIPDEHVKNVTQHVIHKIAEVRQDCVVFFSQPLKAVLNKPSVECVKETIKYANELNLQSTYAFMTCNHFLMYDQYTDQSYWIPDNVGTAGIVARTDKTDEPWFSPAGLIRGIYKNVRQTAWNPSETDADQMYKYSINRVTRFKGEGTVLYGDRTFITRPSALRMVGVRRLLIQLRKLITNASRYTLFEFNDSITRNRFISLVTPYLMQVQAARGLAAFQVVCDESNNTGQVLNEQRFVADIYLRPLYSIQRINLNFILVNNTISFTEAAQG